MQRLERWSPACLEDTGKMQQSARVFVTHIEYKEISWVVGVTNGLSISHGMRIQGGDITLLNLNILLCKTRFAF